MPGFEDRAECSLTQFVKDFILIQTLIWEALQWENLHVNVISDLLCLEIENSTHLLAFCTKNELQTVTDTSMWPLLFHDLELTRGIHDAL